MATKLESGGSIISQFLFDGKMSSEDPNAPKTAHAVPLASLHASGVKGVELKKETPSIEHQPLLSSLSCEAHQSASKSKESTTTSPNSKPSETAQRVEWCDWEEEHTQLDDLDEEPILTMILNSLMFCGLVITPDVLWTFPRQVIEYGGVYFIFIYFFMLFLIAFPLLHMEIFVGQRCQSGIIKTTRMYGYGFECLGIGIFCFTLIKSLPGVQDSYILIRHLINIFDDAEGIMSCEYDGYEGEIDSAHCVSLVDDMNCPNGQLYYGKCTNTSILPSIMGIIVSVKDHYSSVCYTTYWFTVLLLHSVFSDSKLFAYFSSSYIVVLSSFSSRWLTIS